MKLTSLTAISPIDGRYLDQLTDLQPLFSEYGLIRNRVIVEIRWFEMLANHKSIKELPSLSQKSTRFLQNIIDNFSESDAKRVKQIEKKTHHDVKAVEYFLKEKFDKIPALRKHAEFLHFGCTSEDINNLAYGLAIKSAKQKILLPAMKQSISTLQKLSRKYAATSMLSRTHGQSATPTTLGKEFANFVVRLKKQMRLIESVEIMGKLNGAVGNYNAHHVAYPKINWKKVSAQFIKKLGLTFNSHTTQIEPHDYIAELSHAMMRFNTILIDLSRDCWLYISNHYFKLKTQPGEIGSSTMPHKVNPIDFENAEGNLGLANSLLGFFAEKLPISRWQRDLSDSTVLRNIGVAFGHCTLAYKSILKGLNKIEPDKKTIANDINNHWEILAEAAQTVMRRYGIENPYEKLKKLTRGKSFNQTKWIELIDSLEIPTKEKDRLKKLTPSKYIGLANKLAKL